MKRCLIIGDGNFTFSLAFCYKYSTESWIVVATSFEKKDEVIERYGLKSAEVIDTLTAIHDIPGCNIHCTVMYEVDGTKLDQISFLNNKTEYFQRIIFNFPHCGGKSDIKGNQTLLHKFFTSSSKILDPVEGEVWVTLCKGQGGTPQDDLSRGYTNTWKIVEQAAEGSLILTRVFPFEPLDWPGYSQTGYRGTGKGFMVEGALTHVFRAPCMDTSVWRQTSMLQSVEGCRYCCTGMDKVKMIRLPELADVLYCNTQLEYPLMEQEWHPLVKMREDIATLIKKLSITNTGGLCSECHSSILYHKLGSPCLSNYTQDSLLYRNSIGVDTHGGTPSKVIALESHLEQRLPAIAQYLSTHQLEYLLVSGVCVTSQGSSTYRPSLVAHQLMLCLAPSIHANLASLSDLAHRVLAELMCDEDGSSFNCNTTSESQTIISYRGTSLATCHSIPANSFAKGTKPIFSCVFELDQLVMIKHKIADVRVLRSKDVHLYRYFTNSSTPSSPPPVYLYPPSYIHDVSFWVSRPDDTTNSDETDIQPMVKVKLESLIRQCCGMMVVSVCIIDVYRDWVGRRISFCFRLTYSPFDSPMTFADSKVIQGKLRESIASTPGWELR